MSLENSNTSDEFNLFKIESELVKGNRKPLENLVDNHKMCIVTTNDDGVARYIYLNSSHHSELIFGYKKCEEFMDKFPNLYATCKEIRK